MIYLKRKKRFKIHESMFLINKIDEMDQDETINGKEKTRSNNSITKKQTRYFY